MTRKMNDKDIIDPRMLRIEKQIRQRILAGKRNVWELGKFLCEAKKWLDHGDFQAWIKEKFGNDLSYPSCNNYMKIYQRFENQRELVEKLPLTYLLELTREYQSEEAIETITKIMETEGFDAIKAIVDEIKKGKKSTKVQQIIEKYAEEDHVKYFEWLMKEVVAKMRYAKRLQLTYNPFPKMIGDLYEKGFPFQPDKTLDVLKKMEAEGFIQEIQTAKEVLIQTEKSFTDALNHFSNN